MTTPTPFDPGYRLTDGNQLNNRIANPVWSVSQIFAATVGGTMATSAKVTNTITNVTTASAPNAGITIPQALAGTVLFVANNSANTIVIYAEGGSTINGAAGTVGYSLTAGNSTFITAVNTLAWSTYAFPAISTSIIPFLINPTSANLRAAVTDETGVGGGLVFADTPTLSTPILSSPSMTTPILGTPQSGNLSNCSGLSLTTGVTGILPIANGGTNASTASLTSFNNITGYTPTNVTGNTGTYNLVFSNTPTITTPILSGNVRQVVSNSATSSYYNFGDGSSNFAQIGGYYDSATTGHLELYALSTTSTEVARVYAAGMSIKSGVAPTAYLQLGAGTATANTAPLKFTSGPNLTTAETGALEYDGANIFSTLDATTGRGYVPSVRRFMLYAPGSAISYNSGSPSALVNFFGANSNIPLVANGVYEIEIVVFFLRTAASTYSITWTLTNSTAPTNMNVVYEMSPVTGVVAAPGGTSSLQAQAYNVTTAAYSFTTGTLTPSVNHYARFKISLVNGAGTSLAVQVTVNTAGSITPGTGSYWTCARIPSSNVGTYSA